MSGGAMVSLIGFNEKYFTEWRYYQQNNTKEY